MLGFEGATAMAPIEPMGMPSSEIGNQVRPEFSVFQTPPPTEPM